MKVCILQLVRVATNLVPSFTELFYSRAIRGNALRNLSERISFRYLKIRPYLDEWELNFVFDYADIHRIELILPSKFLFL